MIALRPMLDSEFAAYLDYFIPDYAAEMAANYRLPLDQAVEQARREVANDLPDGPATAGHVLSCLAIAEVDAPVGFLWYRPNVEAGSAFILDFHVRPAWQGRGLAKAALAALETRLASEGLHQIRLRVAANNHRARHVYESCGFAVTGINMAKTIGTAASKPTPASEHPVIALERAALDRWCAGDPSGFLDISAPDVRYFDPFLPTRLDGLDKLTAYYESLRGKIFAPVHEMIEPAVTEIGDTAILSFRFVSRAGSEGDEMRWNCTEVYRRDGNGWRIVQTHWSFGATPNS